MEAIYQSIALYLGRTIKPLGALARPWATLAPIKGLLLLLLFYLSISFGFIIYFSEAFNFGKRIVALHISIVSCLILVTTVSLGALTRFRRIRGSRPARLALSLVPATGFSLLVTLYFADYVANSLWGNNVNYDLASQYVFGGGIFQSELQLLPAKAYLAWAACLIAIFLIHLALAGSLFNSLEELFLPGRRLSLFRRPPPRAQIRSNYSHRVSTLRLHRVSVYENRVSLQGQGLIARAGCQPLYEPKRP